MTIDTDRLRRLADGFAHTPWAPFLHDAADALDAQAAEIERLIGLLRGRTMSCSQCETTAAENERLRDLLDEARAVLASKLPLWSERSLLIDRIDAALGGRCATCNGTGEDRSLSWARPCPDCVPVYSDGAVCATCNGTGRIKDPDDGFDPWLNISGELPCPDCGAGR